ncbi:MAG TPA: hypothetical protein VGP31_19685 [Planosporangium sp.]|nr:hypothetical protein [Planosporangium sp.]
MLDVLRGPKRGRPRAVVAGGGGSFPAVRFLVATSGHGVVLYDRGRLVRVVPGNCYGLTRCGDWWFGFQRQGAFGRIVRFQLVGRHARHLRTVLYGLNYGVHQVDFVGDRLVVVDTLKNRLLVYDDATHAGRRSWRCWSSQVYPVGVREVADFRWDRLRCDRDSLGYRHFNSVFRHRDRLYLVAHNRTVASGRRSQLYVLDDALVVREIRDLGSADVHNFWTDGTRQLFCASAKGTLRLDGVDAVALGGYTRGLSVSGDLLLVGSSRFDVQRRSRGDGDGQVHAVTTDFSVLGHVVLPRTQIHEIRRVDAADLGLSNEAEAVPVAFTAPG